MAIWQFICDHDNGVTNFHFEIAADILDEEEIALKDNASGTCAVRDRRADSKP